MVQTVGDLMIRDSDIVKAITKSLSDTNQRIGKHHDEFKVFEKKMDMQSVKNDDQFKSLKELFICGFVIMIGGFAMVLSVVLVAASYIITRLDQISLK